METVGENPCDIGSAEPSPRKLATRLRLELVVKVRPIRDARRAVDQRGSVTRPLVIIVLGCVELDRFRAPALGTPDRSASPERTEPRRICRLAPCARRLGPCSRPLGRRASRLGATAHGTNGAGRSDRAATAACAARTPPAGLTAAGQPWARRARPPATGTRTSPARGARRLSGAACDAPSASGSHRAVLGRSSCARFCELHRRLRRTSRARLRDDEPLAGTYAASESS